MGSIFSSSRALQVLAALEQRPEGLRLTQIAEAIQAPVSSAQVALGMLIGDGLVVLRNARRPVFAVGQEAEVDVDKVLDVAFRRIRDERILAAAVRANRAVEFAARDPAGLLLVFRWDSEPSDEARLNRALARLDLVITRFGHHELRQRLLADGSPRERAIAGRVIVGSVDRSFPDAARHGSPDAPLLSDLHPAIVRPSRRALTRIARQFGLREMRVFGSAVHADFRPDSDIDVMVRRRPGVPRTLESELGLRRDLEQLLGRDVDVTDASVLREAVRQKAESEGLLLIG